MSNRAVVLTGRVRDFASGDGRGFVVEAKDAKGVKAGGTVVRDGRRYTVAKVVDKKDGFIDLVLDVFEAEA